MNRLASSLRTSGLLPALLLSTPLFAAPLVAPQPPRSAPPKAPEVPAEIPPQTEILQPGVKLTLLVEHPDLVTPTGIGVAEDGSIYTIASHTHHRPEGYPGPEHDEVLVFDAHGKNRRVFYNRTVSTMQLLLGPDGWVYLAERGRILRVRDSDGDGAADTEETLAALDTLSDYPHNGLSGMAWHPDGGLVFSLGENFGKDWTLTATDGSKAAGRGEGGVFRCTPDGREMRRIARGFWNPFGITVNETGEIFAAENDPGSRPPCRLLHIVEGADYGFQWVYGSAPVHPFVAWNGELRGTLGMVSPCGEGPCAIVPLGGGVLIPSWSDHRVEYYPLSRDGAGYRAERIVLVEGGDYFRPTGMVRGPDGAFYFNDWVFSSYPIHQRGRLWKMEIDPAAAADWLKAEPDPANDAVRLASDLREGRHGKTDAELLALARSPDRYLADAALTALARKGETWTEESLRALPLEDRLLAFVALRRSGLEEEKWVRALIDDPDPEIRFECLRWIADGVLSGFSDAVERVMSDPQVDFRLFEAALAASNTLRGDPGAGVTNPDVLMEKILDAATPDRVKAYSLRLAPPAHKSLTTDLLAGFLESSDATLALEAVRTLCSRTDNEAREALAKVATDPSRPAALRAEAITGLSVSTLPEHLAALT
ncbi:MAG TPA: hypothetical protein PLA50_08105, partial [Bacteroidia bacterium]|nr:hypothetical protein [Bacteroidia bacterium]